MAKSYIDNPEQAKKYEDEKSHFPLGEYILTLSALTFLTDNASATFRMRSKLLEFLESLDEASYVDNQDICWRLALARSIGRAVIRHSARSLPAVEHRVLEDTEWADFHAHFFEAFRNNTGHVAEGYVLDNELSDESLLFVDEFISTRLRFSYLWKSRNVLNEIVQRLEADDMGEINQFNDNVLSVLEQIVQKGRAAAALSSQQRQDFATGDVSFEAAIRAAHIARNRPQSVVQTGVQMMNEMLGGGYEGSRVYVYFARSGDWKSGQLCSAAFWACDPRFNPSFVTRDPTRQPCVLFVTQENDMYETVERMLSFALGSHIDLRGADVDQIVRMMEAAFSSETCQFIFKYRASRSISTADLEGMIHDEYLAGREVIMVVQDYIKRIRPMETYRDARHLEMGAVVDDFSSMKFTCRTVVTL